MKNTTKPYLIVIYGKDGCELCARLKDEVHTMLGEEQLEGEIGLDYQNLSTVEGMMAYAISETVNGQRIPALQVMKYDSEKQRYRKIPDSRPEERREGTGELCVPVYLQLQTDYSSPQPAIQREQVLELVGRARESA